MVRVPSSSEGLMLFMGIGQNVLLPVGFYGEKKIFIRTEPPLIERISGQVGSQSFAFNCCWSYGRVHNLLIITIINIRVKHLPSGSGKRSNILGLNVITSRRHTESFAQLLTLITINSSLEAIELPVSVFKLRVESK